MERAITPLRTAVPPSRDAGVTLIELVVVVAVMAVLGAGLSLAVGRAASSADADMAQFRQQYEQLRAQAVHARHRYGLSVTPKGRHMMARHGGTWQDLGPPRSWRAAVHYADRHRRAAPGVPDIQFLPNGQTSAFTISFGSRRCQSDGWTGLTCDAG